MVSFRGKAGIVREEAAGLAGAAAVHVGDDEEEEKEANGANDDGFCVEKEFLFLTRLRRPPFLSFPPPLQSTLITVAWGAEQTFPPLLPPILVHHDFVTVERALQIFSSLLYSPVKSSFSFFLLFITLVFARFSSSSAETLFGDRKSLSLTLLLLFFPLLSWRRLRRRLSPSFFPSCSQVGRHRFSHRARRDSPP
jgi:hypothetical protein